MKPWIMLFLRIALGSVFLITGFAKIMDSHNFAHSIMNLSILSPWLVPIVTFVVPIIEICLGIMLMGGIFICYISRVILGLLAVFSMVILIQILQGNIIDCNCFGALLQSQTDIYALLRNVLLAGISILIAKQNPNLFSLDKLLQKQKSLLQFFAYNWLEILAGVTIIILLGLTFGLLIPTVPSEKLNLSHSNQQEILNTNFSRSKFASVAEIKKKLFYLQPKADSISVVLLKDNIELYDLFVKRKHLERYIAVIEDVECQTFNDLHFLVKISRQYEILDFLFILPIDEVTKYEITDQFRHTDIRNKFGIKSIIGNPKWSYYLLIGLRDAGDALHNSSIIKEPK